MPRSFLPYGRFTPRPLVPPSRAAAVAETAGPSTPFPRPPLVGAPADGAASASGVPTLFGVPPGGLGRPGTAPDPVATPRPGRPARKGQIQARLGWALSLLLALGLALATDRVSALGMLVEWIAAWGHETGHALTALATGGRVDHLVLRPDGSGQLSHLGGWALLVAWAGCAGELLWGALLVRLGDPRRRLLLPLLWAGVMFSGFAWAGDLRSFSLVLAVATALALPRALPWGLGRPVTRATGLLVLWHATMAVLDLWQHGRGSDADALRAATWLPIGLWVALWLLWGVAVVAGLTRAEWRAGGAWAPADAPPRAARRPWSRRRSS